MHKHAPSGPQNEFRDKVYPCLGFDNLDFMEDYRERFGYHGWCSSFVEINDRVGGLTAYFPPKSKLKLDTQFKSLVGEN